MFGDTGIWGVVIAWLSVLVSVVGNSAGCFTLNTKEAKEDLVKAGIIATTSSLVSSFLDGVVLFYDARQESSRADPNTKPEPSKPETATPGLEGSDAVVSGLEGSETMPQAPMSEKINPAPDSKP